MKLSSTLYGKSADIADVMLSFISNAAADFARNNRQIPEPLRCALIYKSDAVILIKIRTTLASDTSEALIGFQGNFYTLSVIADNGVKITALSQTNQVSPRLAAKIWLEIR